MMLEKEMIDRLASKIEAAVGDMVIAVYLFGSTLKPRGFKGDLDIALLVEERSLCEGVIRLQNRLYQRLRETLGRKDIDVVILNAAPSLLRYAAIKDGILICCRDDDKRVEFEVRTMLKYFDFSYLRRMFREDMLRRLRDGRFAKPDNRRAAGGGGGGAHTPEEEAEGLTR